AVEDLFGIPREQLIGQPTSKMDDIVEGCSCTDIVSAVFSSEKEIRKELEIKIQGVTWIDSTFLPEYDEEGEIEYILKVSRDITAAKNNETHLIRQKELYQALSFTNHAIVYSKTVQELFDKICRIAVDQGKITYCWIATINPKTQELELQSVSGGDEEYIKDIKTLLAKKGKLLLDKMLESSELIFNDIDDPEANLTICEEMARKYDYKSLANFLLSNNTTTYGILTFCSDQKDFFEDEIQDLIREMVGDISFALNNFEEQKWHTNAEETLLKNQTTISEMLIDTVAAIATTIEMRDPYTAGHQRRVAALACAIAHEIGMESEKIEGLRLASQIHDVGKIQIPAEILSKPSRLSEVEFLLIKVHPEAGYEILKDIEFPWSIATIIRQHHEKLDGSGYPHGLKGDKILLEARILTVADIVEAMASHRPYRAALGIDVALEEIQKERGIKLDSDAVDACVALFKEKQFRFPEAR
ncbi:MAG: HD domain-containing protein, partial [Sulfuricurvum sp.]|nr:HD domain-containing protein [Sulfuricurvum sp.]